MNQVLVMYLVMAPVTVYMLFKAVSRLRLSRAKHPSLSGHAKWSRRISRLVPYIEYGPEHFFCSDSAPPKIVSKRRQGMDRLVTQAQRRSPETVRFSASLEDTISDVLFTSSYRVPFPYRKHLPAVLRTGSIAQETEGIKIRDLDGNWNYDLTGSYGVNVFGCDFYKECVEAAIARAGKLGPVLGPYHPLIRDNVERLKSISGLDEVSFHMSGTEAVMQAVRLARYHTSKTHLVRLNGAYHGWWDGVQPGIGNRRRVDDVYTLADLSDATLKVLNTRRDIACVLVNPLQALHPNADAPADASLINSSRSACFDREKYTDWLMKIRDACTCNNIVLIFDEVFTGFRLAYRGAQEYFGIQADIVTYGKTLGGGLPIGVVCGQHRLMKRFRDDRPLDISFARGTFNSHPYVMASMDEFLSRIEQPEIQQVYRDSEELWNARARQLNRELAAEELPARIANFHSVWTVLYTRPGRYNWMLQFYLRAEGLELSWVGTGRFIMCLNYSDDDFSELRLRFVRAARQMERDGWWWHSHTLTNRSISRQMLKEILSARYPVLGWILDNPLPRYSPETLTKVSER